MIPHSGIKIGVIWRSEIIKIPYNIMKKAGLQYPRTMKYVNPSGFRILVLIISLIMAVGLSRSILSHFFRIDVVDEHRQVFLREQQRNRSLHAQLKEATSDAFIEKQAREKLGLVKDGDTIILLQKSTTGSLREMKEQGELPHWEQWWRLFF